MDFKKIVQQWILLMLGIFLAAQLLSGIQYDSTGALIAVVLILSVLNLLIRPLLILLALPFVVLTLGLGILVINAFLFSLVGELVSGFHVDGFGSAFFGALIVSITGLITNAILGPSKVEVKTTRGVSRKSKNLKNGDDVIDI